jgi:hypothetical protein
VQQRVKRSTQRGLTTERAKQKSRRRQPAPQPRRYIGEKISHALFQGSFIGFSRMVEAHPDPLHAKPVGCIGLRGTGGTVASNVSAQLSQSY